MLELRNKEIYMWLPSKYHWYILLLHSVLLRKTVSSKMPGNAQNIIFKENTTISLVHTGTLQFVEIFYYFKITVFRFSSKGFFFNDGILFKILKIRIFKVFIVRMRS